MADANVAESTRVAKTKRYFRDKRTNEWNNRVNPYCDAFRVEIIDGGTLEGDISEFDEGVINAAALFGITTVITNAFGNILKDGSPDEWFEAAETRLEALRGGEWSEARQSGPRTSDILEAVVQFRAENGRDSDDEWKAGFLEKLKSGETTTKEILASNPAVRAIFDGIKAKRMAEKAEHSRSLAKGSKSVESDLLD